MGRIASLTAIMMAALCLLASLSVNSQAQWSSDPTVDTPICKGAGNVISDGVGGLAIAYVVTHSDLQNYDMGDIYLQKVNAAGVLLWPDAGKPICVWDGIQSGTAICNIGGNGQIIVWYDSRNHKIVDRDIYAQKVNMDSDRLWPNGGVPICQAPGDQYNPIIIGDGSNGAIIAWQDYRNGVTNSTIFAQRINSAGNTQWTTDGVSVLGGTIKDVTMIGDGAGGAIFILGFLAQHINASGDVQWTAPICKTDPPISFEKIVPDRTGGAIIIWNDRRGKILESDDIYAQKLNASGILQWHTDGVTVVNTNVVYAPTSIASDGAGGAIIFWCDSPKLSAFSYINIYAQKLNVNGMAQWGNKGAQICMTKGKKRNLSSIDDNEGGAIMAWENYGQGSIFAQKVNMAGELQWGTNGVLITTIGGSPVVYADNSGGAIITWRGRDASICARHILSNGTLDGVTNVNDTK
jgi:hypothetical protein